MHSHEQLLARLFQSLNDHDHLAMGDCYHDLATFRDIAFNLKGRRQIQAMWSMICSDNAKGKSTISATVKDLSADADHGRVVVVEDYLFRATGKSVHNEIVSSFAFRDGKILRQTDTCDPIVWARQAYGGCFGFLMGRWEGLRRCLTMHALRKTDTGAFQAHQ